MLQFTNTLMENIHRVRKNAAFIKPFMEMMKAYMFLVRGRKAASLQHLRRAKKIAVHQGNEMLQAWVLQNKRVRRNRSILILYSSMIFRCRLGKKVSTIWRSIGWSIWVYTARFAGRRSRALTQRLGRRSCIPFRARISLCNDRTASRNNRFAISQLIYSIVSDSIHTLGQAVPTCSSGAIRATFSA
ncbi:uncharacterized protein LOC143209592 [Lasioglossum baleicum]|uniref:uncharacterized protein LOC143209592 n=1 Tax=Lasioglossum baleicum TaxID=434251 RepID=UPI003FCC64FA